MSNFVGISQGLSAESRNLAPGLERGSRGQAAESSRLWEKQGKGLTESGVVCEKI